jgi:transposase
MAYMDAIPIDFELLRPHLNERTRRLVAAAMVVGREYGTQGKISKATGVSHREIRRGLEELAKDSLPLTERPERIRKAGGGRKKTDKNDPTVVEALKEIVESTTRGDPESRLLWTTKSLRNLASELKNLGHKISHVTVGCILSELGYSLQGNKKVLEGTNHPDRNAQFEHINKRVKQHQRMKQPVISVDCKKHELIGNYKNNGQEYCLKGEPIEVKDHDFIDKELGKAIPYGIYDITHNCGFVSVGVTKDTSLFAVQSIRSWWDKMGKVLYPKARKLLITADCGGSNGYRRRLWLHELSKFATDSGLTISVCHFPVGTSKWNKIEHRLFSFITMNWRGRPLTTLEVIVSLIAGTTTTTGLYVQSEVDETTYQTGLKIDDEDLANMNIKREKFHGEWNYIFSP